MIEIIRKSDGESIVYTSVTPLDAAYAAGVPELLVSTFIRRVLDGEIEPVITDGGMRFSRENSRFVVNFYR